MYLGKQIRALRARKGVRQEALAGFLGVSAQAVSKWETEASLPDVVLLPRIAVYFGVTIDELFRLPAEEQFQRIENALWHEIGGKTGLMSRRLNTTAYFCSAASMKTTNLCAPVCCSRICITIALRRIIV